MFVISDEDKNSNCSHTKITEKTAKVEQSLHLSYKNTYGAELGSTKDPSFDMMLLTHCNKVQKLSS